MYLSRQLYEEALHVQFYLTLLDNYIPDLAERDEAFAAIENIPSIRAKAEFCFKWIDSIGASTSSRTDDDRKQFLLNLICFAACIEGLFFFAAFAYVYFLRSKGLLNGLAAGTNWVFRDESGHMNFAFEVVDTVRREQPELFDDELDRQIERDDRRGRRRRDAVRRGRARRGRAGHVASPTPASTSSTSPTSASPCSACPSGSARRTRSASWSCRTCRSSRTSSSARCRPTRSASPATSPSTRSSEAAAAGNARRDAVGARQHDAGAQARRDARTGRRQQDRPRRRPRRATGSTAST